MIDASGGNETPLNTEGGNVSEQTANLNPSVVDLTDDHMVRIPGQNEPVKYGELYKRLQADHTRKTTEAAQLKAALQKQQEQWTTQKQQEENQLRQLAAELLQRQRAGQAPQGGDLLSKLKGLRYLDGETAAEMFREIQEGGFGQIVNAINERDQVIQSLYKQVLGLNRTVQEMQGRYQTSEFDTKINRWVSELGLPAEAKDLAKEIYLAYEGDDLDQEFPQILQKRWDSILNAIRSQDKARVDAAKKQAFKIPGKGGAGVAGKMAGLTGKESAKETADYLWEALQGEGLQTT